MNGEGLKCGDNWPYHYRGTTYHCNQNGEVWWRSSKDGIKLPVSTGHEEIVKQILNLKTDGGIFKITETGDVLTKVEESDIFQPVFVCEMDEQFVFPEGVDTSPKSLQPGDLWPGFYDGARYSFSRNAVWWHNPDGPRQYVEEEFPEILMETLNKFKPKGGSFRITENGFVIALVEVQPLPNNLKEQYLALTDVQQQLVKFKIASTEMLPVYIGKFHQGISLKEPTDFTKPLTEEEKNKMLKFLEGFSSKPNLDFGMDNDLDEPTKPDDPEDEYGNGE